MSQIQVSYDGEQHCTALQERHKKTLPLDCPLTGKGEEFSPGELVAAGLAGCMLMSMGAVAMRHALDVSGATVGVDMSTVDKPETHIGSIDVTVNMPRHFSEEDRRRLEGAAAACPIKHSFRSDTEISTHFNYPD